MKPYFETKLICGDTLIELPKLTDNSIDLITTDPPYGYYFMGKDWDKVVIKVEVWQECLRVLKPGASCFVMSAPRQDVLQHVIYNLSQAGFNTGFTSIYWTYASGFPKAGNIGKMVDKKNSIERKEIEHQGQVASTMGSNTMDGGKANPNYKYTKGNSKLEGSYSGFQPKPAVEVIIVVMKPLSEKTYVDQAMKNGKGITWFDDCRIPYESEKDKESSRFGTQMDIRNNNYKTPQGVYGKNVLSSENGRFPANLLVSDDVLNDGKFRQPAGNKNISKRKSGFGCDNQLIGSQYNDGQSFSRYFDLDKWAKKTFPFLIVPKASKSEKHKGLDNESQQTNDGRNRFILQILETR